MCGPGVYQQRPEATEKAMLLRGSRPLTLRSPRLCRGVSRGAGVCASPPHSTLHTLYSEQEGRGLGRNFRGKPSPGARQSKCRTAAFCFEELTFMIVFALFSYNHLTLFFFVFTSLLHLNAKLYPEEARKMMFLMVGRGGAARLWVGG